MRSISACASATAIGPSGCGAGAGLFIIWAALLAIKGTRAIYSNGYIDTSIGEMRLAPRYRRDQQPSEKVMKLSARNILKGKVVQVTKGKTTAHVRLDIGGAIVTSSITNEAVDELKLKKGQTAFAVIKASDVMIGVK